MFLSRIKLSDKKQPLVTPSILGSTYFLSALTSLNFKIHFPTWDKIWHYTTLLSIYYDNNHEIRSTLYIPNKHFTQIRTLLTFDFVYEEIVLNHKASISKLYSNFCGFKKIVSVHTCVLIKSCLVTIRWPFLRFAR